MRVLFFYLQEKEINKKMASRNNLVIENAELMWCSYKNFSGRATKYNRQGVKNFCLIIPDEKMAMQMKEEGWNVKIRAPRTDDDLPVYYISVNVSYGNDYFGDPKVVRMTSRTKVELTEDTIGQLDEDEILNADVVIRPHYSTSDDGETRIKGYLKEMYVTVQDSLSDKYTDI